MFRTALCFNLGVLSRGRVVLGDRGAEFPESPALDTEVIAGPQPGALGFRADAPDVSGAGNVARKPWMHSMEAAPPALERVLS